AALRSRPSGPASSVTIPAQLPLRLLDGVVGADAHGAPVPYGRAPSERLLGPNAGRSASEAQSGHPHRALSNHFQLEHPAVALGPGFLVVADERLMPSCPR